MPLLGGLFHRRSTDTQHVQKALPPPPPIYGLHANASSTKLKLPFRRKPAVTRHVPEDTSHSVVSLNDTPSPPRISSVMSDSGHGLPPPPRKSSLFGIYNDSHQSVHSLPNEPSSHVHPDTHTRLSLSDVRPEHRPPAAQAHKRAPGLFSWARERTKSKPLPPPSTVSSVASTSPSAADDDSFNLKSFRHVRADSPPTSPEKLSDPSSTLLLPPARPRPRGDSVASDPSQRISVAAFREAQARSRTNSPAPSLRPPSIADTLRVDVSGRKRASTVSVVSGSDHHKNVPPSPMPSTRPDSSADTSSDSESSEDDEEVDSDGEPISKPVRKRTITRRVDGIRARSDAGHSPATASSGHVSPARQDPPRSAPPLAYQPDQTPSTRPRASASTSALTPNGAARRASILAAAHPSSRSPQVQSKPPPRKPKEDPDESNDPSDADSDDMPLRDLALPRRPASSASNSSNSRLRTPGKPLIDISSLAGGQPILKPILRHENSVKNAKRQEQDVEKDQPFSIPAALAYSSPPIAPSVSNLNAGHANEPVPATDHHRPSSAMPAPMKSEEPDNDDDLMNAIRLVGALDKEQDHASGTAKSPSRIVPRPIREREPPTSFTVLSRPPQRQSTAETSASLSPVSQTHSVTTSPARSPQLEPGTRQRASTMSKFSAENEKSDTLSIASVARSSASRGSSRIPPVPLVRPIPDSPSVKEDYKHGHPRAASRTPAANTVQGHSQPAPTIVPPMPTQPSNKMASRGFQPSPMPQRPFAGNRSTREESPAGSSTGDSSSGQTPFTPRDGSDIGARSKEDDMDSTLKARGHAKRPSVTFEDSQPARGREWPKTGLANEERTRERRRSEAKAALELGKIVNGRGPLVHDGSDEDMVLRGRNPTINVTMENGGMPGWAPWQQPMGPVVPPQFNNDPAYLAAHQRALLIAKQAYQMAVAQQAMQMAGEEWERSSNIGFGSGGSVYGGGSGGSVFGGGSVYGGGSGGSVYGGGAGMAPMGMMGMNMGMLMPPNQWGRSSVAFPSSAGSAYGGINSSQSEYGGVGGGGWGTRSVYGDSFGSASRTTFVGNSGGSSTASAYGGNPRPRAYTGAPPPPSSSSSRPPGKAPVPRNRAAPPSSWKNGPAPSHR